MLDQHRRKNILHLWFEVKKDHVEGLGWRRERKNVAEVSRGSGERQG